MAFRTMLLLFVAFCAGLMIFASPLPAGAQDLGDDPQSFINRTTIPRPEIKLPSLLKPGSRFENVGQNFLTVALNFVVDQLSLLAGLIAFGYALYGGILYLTSGPNATQAQQGKNMIIGAIVGIMVVALAYVVIGFLRDEIVKLFQP